MQDSSVMLAVVSQGYPLYAEYLEGFMPGDLLHLTFNGFTGAKRSIAVEGFDNLRGYAADGIESIAPRFSNDEAAARNHLEAIFANDQRNAVRGLVAPDVPSVVPSLHFLGVQPMPKTDTRLVKFVQTQSSIPVFGSRVVVELGLDRNLVSVTASVDDVPPLITQPVLSASQALQKISDFTGTSTSQLGQVTPPQLNRYKDDDNRWHLVFVFENVPAVPKTPDPTNIKESGHGLDLSPRDLDPRYDYLVDANDGSIVFYYSAQPMFAIQTPITVPVKCTGVGEDNVSYSFFGTSAPPNYEMRDPMRSIVTCDLQFGDLTTAVSSGVITNTASSFGGGFKAAVSAHGNLTRVFDFYNSVLMRDGIDDKRMQLRGIINCTYARGGSGKEWRNAIWYNNAMWFGQQSDGQGTLSSYSKYLDVIAHELTHGVTQYTCGLVYRDESGALNESLSDIFGVIIANWYLVGADSDPNSWNWRIGDGLGSNGRSLRDMQNPARLGDPAHMQDYLKTSADNGGVHTNSNIHNKAAYNLLVAKDATGALEFKPSEVALFYYLAMNRLDKLADFKRTKDALLNVAATYYGGDQGVLQRKNMSIVDAYQQVGIS